MITTSRLLVLVGLGVLMVGGAATPVLAANVAWGAYSDHSFYGNTAGGCSGSCHPVLCQSSGLGRERQGNSLRGHRHHKHLAHTVTDIRVPNRSTREGEHEKHGLDPAISD